MKALLLATTLMAFVSGDESVTRAEVVDVYDGDTINVRAEIWPNIFWEGGVRIRNIDTPEIGWRARCPGEASMGYQAKALVEEYVGDEVLIINPELGKFAGRVVADVLTSEGVFIDDLLIGAGLANEYHGGKRKGWCQGEEVIR